MTIQKYVWVSKDRSLMQMGEVSL